MCSCDFEVPTFFTSTIRKSRKQHKCCECGAIIEPSSSYVDIFGVWDGEARSFKQCLECSEIGDRYQKEADCCYGIGELYECLIEGDFLDFDEESQQWKSTVDWLRVVRQEPLNVGVAGGAYEHE